MNKLSLKERQAQVIELLNPDEIRRHRVAEGLELTELQIHELNEIAGAAAIFAKRMSALSNAALQMDALDQQSRLIRTLCVTEPLFQARKRQEVDVVELPDPALTKVDIVISEEGLKIVEIEPSKIRGLGYGRMLREQTVSPVGLGSAAGLAPIIGDVETMVALSDHDRFHIPELSVLGRFVGNLLITNQKDLLTVASPQVILASPLKRPGGTEIEQALRLKSDIVSDRRPDLESKGALALVHNTGEDEALELRLLEFVSADEIKLLRRVSPPTHHTKLLQAQQRSDMLSDIQNARSRLFAKPMTDSGTRGMVTPNDTDRLQELLAKPKQANQLVLQDALQVIPQTMESMDVLDGDIHTSDMNVRITIHVDKDGNIIEASVVGSPHDYLAHGGKTSVITSLEAVK